MYGETGLLLPYYQNTLQDSQQQLEEFCRDKKSNDAMNNLVEASMIFEYDLGGDWDLFKALEPIINEPVLGLDPMTAAAVTSCGAEVISSEGLKAADIESLQSEQLLDDVSYDKDILGKDPTEASLFEILDIKIPDSVTEGKQVQKDKSLRDMPFQKSVSSGCLSSMDWMQGASPNFIDLPGMDSAYGIRRAFSEADIKTLGSSNISLVHPPLERSIITSNCTIEERMEKLSRYRNKKAKRNFGRKIKYACRKALADNQPRIRGRFAKTEEFTSAKG